VLCNGFLEPLKQKKIFISVNMKRIFSAMMLDNGDEDDMLLLLLLRKREQIRTRNDLRNSALCKPADSSWAHLYTNGDDASFINVIGITRGAFDNLHKQFQLEYNRLSRNHSKKGGRPNKVDSTQALGMILQFYSSTIELKNLGQLHGVVKSVCSTILKKADDCLSAVLAVEPLARIVWPNKSTQNKWGKLVERKYPDVKGRFGFVDGKNFHVQKPSNIDHQNACYNGWLHATLITGVLCFGVDGTLIWGKHNCVGSWNDGDISRELQWMLMDDNLLEHNHGIVSDTAFPVGKALVGRIVSPLKENELERADPRARPALLRLSSSITSLRQACEWGMGSVEKAFRQLLLPLPFNQELRMKRLNNIFRLWNYRCRTTHISQIKSVFL
jgi:hypothetical protein